MCFCVRVCLHQGNVYFILRTSNPPNRGMLVRCHFAVSVERRADGMDRNICDTFGNNNKKTTMARSNPCDNRQTHTHITGPSWKMGRLVRSEYLPQAGKIFHPQRISILCTGVVYLTRPVDGGRVVAHVLGRSGLC